GGPWTSSEWLAPPRSGGPFGPAAKPRGGRIILPPPLACHPRTSGEPVSATSPRADRIPGRPVPPGTGGGHWIPAFAGMTVAVAYARAPSPHGSPRPTASPPSYTGSLASGLRLTGPGPGDPRRSAARAGRGPSAAPVLTRLAQIPIAARAMLNGPAPSPRPRPRAHVRRHPFRPLADRLPPYRRRAHGAVQLALRPPYRREDAAPDRGHRPRALDRCRRRRDPRRPHLARAHLGGRAGP